MKNLKKLVSVVLALTMIISSMAFVSAKTFGDVDTSASYAEAVSVLADLSILNGDEEGNFNPDANIKRSEFAAVLCRALGQENAANGSMGVVVFDDVAAEHWASGYIAWAAQQKIVNGKGDGKFDPDAPVKYEEAVKMIAVALGYEPAAAKKGGYPTGYMVVAGDKGVTNGVKLAGSANAPRSIVAKLVYNAMSAQLLEEEYITLGNDSEYKWSKDTILSSYLSVAKVTATIDNTSTSKPALATTDGDKVELTVSAVAKNQDDVADIIALVDTGLSETIWAGDVDVAPYVAQKVTAYIGLNEDDEAVLLSVVGAAKASAKEEISENIEVMTAVNNAGVAQFTFEYLENEDDNYNTEIDIADDADVFVNGVKITGVANKVAAFNGKADIVSKVVFMKSGASSDYDQIFLTQYAYAVVDSVKVDSEIIKLSAGSLTLSTDTRGKNFTYTIALEDGTEIGLADLEKNDVLNITCGSLTSLSAIKTDTTGIKMNIIVTRNAVEGAIDEEVVAGQTYVINDAEYDIVAGSVSTPEVGESYRYLLNIDGKIVGEDEDWVSEEAGVAKNYGFVLAVGSEKDFNTYIYKIKLFKMDGTTEIIPVAEELTVYDNTISGVSSKKEDLTVATTTAAGVTTVDAADGSKDDQNDYMDLIGKAAATTDTAANVRALIDDALIAYELNSAGEIDVIKFAGSVEDDNNKYLHVAAIGTGDYDALTEEFDGKLFNSKSILLSVPVKGSGSSCEVDVDAIKVAAFADLDEDTTYANGYLYDVDVEEETIGLALIADAIEASNKNAMAVVVSVSTATAGEKVSFYQAGEFKSFVIDEDCALEGNLTAGDIFHYTLNDDVITGGEIVYDVDKDASPVTYATGAGWTAYNPAADDGVQYAEFWTLTVSPKYVTAVASATKDAVTNEITYVKGANYKFAADEEIGTVAMFNVAKSGSSAVKDLNDITTLYEANELYAAKNYIYKTVVKLYDGKVVDAVQYQIPVLDAAANYGLSIPNA